MTEKAANTEIKNDQPAASAKDAGTDPKAIKDEDQAPIKRAKRTILLIRTFFALVWSLLTYLADRNQLPMMKTIYQCSMSMFTLFLILDAPIVGYYIYSGLPRKLKAEEEEDIEEQSPVLHFARTIKNLAGHISILSLAWNLATDAAIYMFFLCALCGVY